MNPHRYLIPVAVVAALSGPLHGAGEAPDFNRDIRPILSNKCLACHGPDEEKRKAKLRLDTPEGATADLGGYAAVVAGDAAASELIDRVTTADPDEVMPPPDKGSPLEPGEVDLLRRWIESGAAYDLHWSYAPPVKIEPPTIVLPDLTGNEIDRFLVTRQRKEGLEPAPVADRETLARRVTLDLTGLPPGWDEVRAFAAAARGDAYERLVDGLLAGPAFGEHWARLWLDQARYADSSGYPSDRPRQIWGYRDWVIGAFNRNLPFDRFTIEQLAGDLLPNPSDAQLIATAFHRNTMTQNEGGTSDEEFRVAAVVDRVNTTMEVWMGTTMACAQCHTHKYDPITQEEYFRFYAILNQTADADRGNEAPLHQFFTPAQRERRAAIEAELDGLEKRFTDPEASDLAGLAAWEAALPGRAAWSYPPPSAAASAAGAVVTVGAEAVVTAGKPEPAKDTLTVEVPAGAGPIEAVRVEALAGEALPGNGPGHAGGNFILSQVRAEFVPDGATPVTARRLRIAMTGDKDDVLALAEVQVFSGGENIAPRGTAAQGSTAAEHTAAKCAIDGNTDGNAAKGKSVAITMGGGDAPWWELTFDRDRPVDRIVVWRRTDKGKGSAIAEANLVLHAADGTAAWTAPRRKNFGPREEFTVSGRRALRFATAFADASQDGFQPADVLADRVSNDKGWAVGGFTGADRALTLLADRRFEPGTPGRLVVTLVHGSKHAHHTLGAFRIGLSAEPKVRELERLPAAVRRALAAEAASRSADATATIRDHYLREVAAGLKEERVRVAALRKELAGIKPASVPVMQELPAKDRRVTKIQRRGNWLDLGGEVSPGVPSALHALPAGRAADRLAMAEWLVSRDNPLTARVIVNRFWEALFGTGIVASSEEFGSQGELPLHPELLDWLAVDFMENGWDVKRLVKQLVMSRAYRQDARCTPETLERDPDNRFLARGPRFRPTGEQLRDQALAVSGLLSPKMGGPSVRPMAPKLGLKTAFGGSNDWATSKGEDRHRRSVYTEVRRNSPYASFATFDAPNREVCTIRRNRTNTPLQAFVTLNDPVFVEASQALARRITGEVPDGGVEARLRHAFRLCLARDPRRDELATLGALFEESRAHLARDASAAERLATEPLGPPPAGADLVELAAWTATANVILNLDEFLMRR